MPTHFDGSKEEVRALNAFISLMRCTASLNSRLNRKECCHCLGTAQFGAMEALYHLGALKQSDLARKLLVTGGNITQVVDGLLKLGLVDRVRSSDDRRVVMVALTSEGVKLMRRAVPEHVRHIVDEFSVLTTAEQNELRRICKKLGTQAER
ncbi:MAG: MarR family transcriptional regulator [Bdellovibrionales bacterium]|nr:MarR family transcriptional regulator [Bdellovibrionales bacterium]